MSEYNKKRNTYFLYDVLIRKYIKTLNEGNVTSKVALNVTEEYFHKDVILGKERKIFEQVLTIKDYDLTPEERLSVLRQSKELYSRLDKDKIFQEQTRLLNKMSFLFGKNYLNEQIDNYKLFANVYQYLTCESIAESIVLEKKVLADLEKVEDEKVERKVKGVPPTLLENQKKLVNLYESENPGFYMYLYDQIKEMKEVLLEHSVCSECEVCDVNMKSGIIKIYHKLQELSKRGFEEGDFSLIFKVQELVEEGLKKKAGV